MFRYISLHIVLSVFLDGYKTRRARVKIKSVDRKKNTCLVEITIHEGHNRQVRKMIESVGKKVIKLKRERYAIFDLKGLKVGEYCCWCIRVKLFKIS